MNSLRTYDIKPFSSSRFFVAFDILALHIPEEVGKFIGGGFLGFMVALSALMDRRKGAKDWSSTFWRGLVFGFVFAFLGVFIPTIWNPWVNYIGFPIAQMAIILLLSKWSKKEK